MVRQSLADAEKDALRRLLAVVESFRELNPTMSVHTIMAYLMVALDEGNGPNEYGKRSGLGQPVMTRLLLDLSDEDRRGEEGLKLIKRKPRLEHRGQIEALLTPRGVAFAHKLIRAMSLPQRDAVA
jgi:DNA-binding MarR family transcriptional regulator